MKIYLCIAVFCLALFAIAPASRSLLTAEPLLPASSTLASAGIASSPSTVAAGSLGVSAAPALATRPRSPRPDRPFEKAIDLLRRLLWMMRRNGEAAIVVFPPLEVDASLSSEK